MTLNRRQIFQLVTLGGVGTFTVSRLVSSTTTSSMIAQAKEPPIATDNQYSKQISCFGV